MARLIDVSKPTQKLLRNISPTEPLLDPADIARALGAEPAGVILETGLAPPTLLAVREELFQRLQSSGGRPALEGTTRRVKIPLSDEEWRQLDELAGSLSSAGCAPSAGQVASVLLSAALRQVVAEKIAGQPNSALARMVAAKAADGTTKNEPRDQD